MQERPWRPSEPTERAHEADRAAWRDATHGSQIRSKAEKDALFTSEEAKAFDRGTVDRFDVAKDDWVPHQPQVPAYDAFLREESGPKSEPG